MKRFRMPLLSLILLSLAGLLAWGFHRTFQRVEVEVKAPWSLAAREDSTLLFQRWLAARGAKVQRVGGNLGPVDLPTGGVVFLLHLEPALTQGDVERLLAWVEAGGSLVVDATAGPGEKDGSTRILLQRLGLQVVDPPEQDRILGQQQDTFTGDPVGYQLDRGNPARIRADRQAWDYIIGSSAGEVLVRRRQGQGRVLVASDLCILHWQQLAKLDHAAWMARVLDEAGVPAQAEMRVWSKPLRQHILTWLGEHARPFLWGLTVLTVLWLWRGLWRFGPRLRPVPLARRSILEHLAAAGSFLWRQGDPEALITRMRHRVVALATRRHPSFPRLPEGARIHWLAQQSRLPEEVVARAMDDRPGAPEDTRAARLATLLTLARQGQRP